VKIPKKKDQGGTHKIIPAKKWS